MGTIEQTDTSDRCGKTILSVITISGSAPGSAIPEAGAINKETVIANKPIVWRNNERVQYGGILIGKCSFLDSHRMALAERSAIQKRPICVPVNRTKTG
jgi:hypothetical protein